MSIRLLHFSLMLKIVLGRKVPMSSSLRVPTILEILDGATCWSISTLMSFCSLSDKSFWDSNMACSPRWGWWRWLKQLLVWRYHWLLFVRNNISLIGHFSSEHGARWLTHLLALTGDVLVSLHLLAICFLAIMIFFFDLEAMASVPMMNETFIRISKIRISSIQSVQREFVYTEIVQI